MPSLPIELERLIFELAILQDTNCAHKMQIMLVAKRVYEWTRPLLYRVVIVDFTPGVCGDEFVVISNRNARMADIAPFTRHLFCVMYRESQLIELLSTLRNIESLAFFPFIPITPDILKSMDGLPLRRISIYLQKGGLSDAVNHCPTFRNVTHLELISLEKSTWSDYKPLVEFPNLTHLCFRVRLIEDEVFLELLKCCPLLRVLAYTVPSMAAGTCQFSSLRASDEARFLVLETEMNLQDYVADRGRSAKGQIGFWELADIIVEARQRKFFKVNSPAILPRKIWMKYLNDDGIRWYKEWSGEEVESEV